MVCTHVLGKGVGGARIAMDGVAGRSEGQVGWSVAEVACCFFMQQGSGVQAAYLRSGLAWTAEALILPW